MRLPTLALTILAFCCISYGKSKNPLPFASELSQTQTFDILAVSNTNQVQYLGFDWINSYCFGQLLGCAVSDTPATAEYSYGEIVFKTDNWFIYATCFGDGPDAQYKFLAPCWQPGSSAQISPKENHTTLIVEQAGQHIGRGKGHTYSVVSAYNPATRETWGNGTLEAWRMVVAAMGITEELKKMNIDQQLAWSGKLVGLRAAGLANADNLEKVLMEMRSDHLSPR